MASSLGHHLEGARNFVDKGELAVGLGCARCRSGPQNGDFGVPPPVAITFVAERTIYLYGDLQTLAIPLAAALITRRAVEDGAQRVDRLDVLPGGFIEQTVDANGAGAAQDGVFGQRGSGKY